MFFAIEKPFSFMSSLLLAVGQCLCYQDAFRKSFFVPMILSIVLYYFLYQIQGIRSHVEVFDSC